MNDMTPTPLKPKDYATDQEVRWCPGCGDYAIVKAMQSMMAQIQADISKTVFVSGIGCAARFPYYMATYGFHTIHGRAATIATGLKLANPDLDVWIVGGDGDALSIGGNHLIHLLRRNVNCQYLMFNNEIYGLTKGQYSPTSKKGTNSPSSPHGSIEQPMHALSLAIGAGAKFIARAGDIKIKELIAVMKAARLHIGTSFVEILQNCIVYNDGVFSHIMDKGNSKNAQIYLEHGKPMLFGDNGDKGLRLKPKSLELEIITIGEDGINMDDILIHDVENKIMATMLAGMDAPDFPVAMGVIYCQSADAYDIVMDKAMNDATKNPANLQDLMNSGYVWSID